MDDAHEDEGLPTAAVLSQGGSFKVPLVGRTASADPELVLASLALALVMALLSCVSVVHGDDDVGVDRGALGATSADGIAIGNIHSGDGVDINAAGYGAGFTSPVVPEV
ncbi:hypothetical protein PC123_g16520 [Phytophthora cactorum]|nr:hypothetical protein PC120_g20921 [Phytophthora cactorum]KAG4048152.1 hypothetical protein PC123_g16520 [Phytophthora cactorum]